MAYNFDETIESELEGRQGVYLQDDFSKWLSSMSSRAIIGSTNYSSFFVNPLAVGSHEDGDAIPYASACVPSHLHNPLAEEFSGLDSCDSSGLGTPEGRPRGRLVVGTTPPSLTPSTLNVTTTASDPPPSFPGSTVYLCVGRWDATCSPGTKPSSVTGHSNLQKQLQCPEDYQPESPDQQQPQASLYAEQLVHREHRTPSRVGFLPPSAKAAATPNATAVISFRSNPLPALAPEPCAPCTPPLPFRTDQANAATPTSSDVPPASTRTRQDTSDRPASHPQRSQPPRTSITGKCPPVGSWPNCTGAPPRLPKYAAAAYYRRFARVSHRSLEDAAGQRLAEAVFQQPFAGGSLPPPRLAGGSADGSWRRYEASNGFVPGTCPSPEMNSATPLPPATPPNQFSGATGHQPGSYRPCEEALPVGGASGSSSRNSSSDDVDGLPGISEGSTGGAAEAGFTLRWALGIRDSLADLGLEADEAQDSISNLGMTRAVIRQLGLLPVAGR